MSELRPLIEGHPAEQYLADVDDNGKTLLIVGSYPYYNVPVGIQIGADSMTVNKGGSVLGGGQFVDYNVSLHGDEEVYTKLIQPYVHDNTTVITLRTGCECDRVDHTIDAEPVGGTSAIFAVITGLVLGYRDIWMCGVRMEPGTIWYDEHVQSNWELWAPIFRPHLTVVGNSWVAELINRGEL